MVELRYISNGYLFFSIHIHCKYCNLVKCINLRHAAKHEFMCVCMFHINRPQTKDICTSEIQENSTKPILGKRDPRTLMITPTYYIGFKHCANVLYMLTLTEEGVFHSFFYICEVTFILSVMRFQYFIIYIVWICMYFCDQLLNIYIVVVFAFFEWNLYKYYYTIHNTFYWTSVPFCVYLTESITAK